MTHDEHPARPTPLSEGRAVRAGTTSSTVGWRALVLALAIGLVAWSAVMLAGHPLPTWWFALDVATGLVALLGLRWWARAPLVSTLLICVAVVWSSLALGPALVCLGLLGTRRRTPEMISGGLAFVLALLANDALLPGGTGTNWWTAPVLPLLAAVSSLAIGAYLGSRSDLLDALRQRAATAEREAAARVERAKAAERTRIAREMHDVVAHRISTVALLAGALAIRPDLPADQRDASVRTIRDNAESALRELREVLHVLRSDELEPQAAEPPQPTLADLADLVADAQHGGARVDLVVDDQVAAALTSLPSGTGRHAYRIVQESLTNAAKHAAGAPVTLDVTGELGRDLLITVTNDAPPTTVMAKPSGAGLGLVGMAERVAVLGGRLQHGPLPRGGYQVRVRLPWPQAEGEDVDD